jgi:hypothetical protein
MSNAPDAVLSRVDHVVQRRLHRITRMVLAGQLTPAQGQEATFAAESPEYAETVARLIAQFPGQSYAEAFLAARRGQRPGQ